MMLFEILPQQEEPVQADVMGEYISVIRQSLKWPAPASQCWSNYREYLPQSSSQVPCAYFPVAG